MTCSNCREQQDAGDGDPDCEAIGKCVVGITDLNEEDVNLIKLWHDLRGGSELLSPEMILAMNGGASIEDLRLVIAMDNEQNRLDRDKQERQRANG
jgi:hypothetical protein